MSGNTTGRLFRVTTWGESHGKGIGAVIDGCPAHLSLAEADIQKMLDRRKPGGSDASTTRREPDRAHLLSGVFEGKTTGTPIAIWIENKDVDSRAYQPHADAYRPGHGDITYDRKYGIRDWRGGGRSSARETAARVAAGAVAARLLESGGIRVLSHTVELGGVRAVERNFSVIHDNPFLCADPAAAENMQQRVAAVKIKGDSIGGIVEIIARGVPAGLGDPVFDKLDARIAGALMSIGAVKGVEIGAGFAAAQRLGSENNDSITDRGFVTNHAGGILAGISNGDEIIARAAVKPIPSITIPQDTVDAGGNPIRLTIRGRHDISAIPRINIVCEAMVCIVLADHLLRQRTLS
jgi:chorismate synthase